MELGWTFPLSFAQALTGSEQIWHYLTEEASLFVVICFAFLIAMAHQFSAKLSAEFIVRTGQLTGISGIPTEFLGGIARRAQWP